MSAPDNSTPKAAPSLLADTPASVPGAQPGGSRILANLEGRVVPPATPPGTGRRPRAPMLIGALVLISAAGFGAWHVAERGAPANAGTQAATPAVAPTVAPAGAAPAVANAASAPDTASASHTATIVSDDESAGNAKPVPDAVASATVPDDGRLSRALANGARDAGASTPAGGAAPLASASLDANRKHPARGAESRHEAKSAAHAGNAKAEALAKKRHDGRPGSQKDDSDVDLLAVLVARTKPGDGKDASAHASKPATSKLTLAQQVKACGEQGFFEDQLCRWRVCDGHWGKDPACPAAARASTEH
ncbi:hypothetical protein AB4Y44_30315 [Paraburkholderia sp. BR10937]|uniref:hypothetical protein n=1 Tax=Paraburkholderia sp. BR10937 TaxID=3236994 RepID=UPI0034D21843